DLKGTFKRLFANQIFGAVTAIIIGAALLWLWGSVRHSAAHLFLQALVFVALGSVPRWVVSVAVLVIFVLLADLRFGTRHGFSAGRPKEGRPKSKLLVDPDLPNSWWTISEVGGRQAFTISLHVDFTYTNDEIPRNSGAQIVRAVVEGTSPAAILPLNPTLMNHGLVTSDLVFACHPVVSEAGEQSFRVIFTDS